MSSIFDKNLKEISKFTFVPDGWYEASVSGVCTLGRGRVISQEEIDRNPGIYPVYSSQTSNQGRMGSTATFDFDKELVTWTTDGANAGTVFYRTGKFNCTNVCGTLEPKRPSTIDLKFLNYHLGRVAKNYVSYIGNPKLMNDVVARIAFVLPSNITEQQKIAKILTTVDNLIDRTEALIEKYQAIMQGMMHDLFTRGVDANGHLRPHHQDAPHLYKKTELGWIPKEWYTRPLGDYFSYISYGFTNPMPETDNGPYMITAANIFGGRIQYETTRHTAQKAFDTLLTKKSRPEIGDLLLTKDGTLGRLAIVDREGVCINQSVAVLRTNELCEVSLIRYLLETETYQQRMLDDAGGSTIKHIYITVVDKMPIALPIDKEEQRRIGSVIRILNNKLENENIYLNKLRKTKKGLMQDLLTGRVRVQA